MTLDHLPVDAPKHLLGIGEPDDLVDGVARGLDSFDCAVPTRLGRHGMALAPLPGSRFRYDLRRRSNEGERGPLVRAVRARPVSTTARIRPLPLEGEELTASAC